MSFKKGDVVFVSEENLKQMLIPISEGPLFTLSKIKAETSNFPYWETTSTWVIQEYRLHHPTELLKALV